jgi:hypothetical protein
VDLSTDARDVLRLLRDHHNVLITGAPGKPSCSYTYTQSSGGQPGGTFTVTATESWQVAWTAAGVPAGAPAGGNLGPVTRTRLPRRCRPTRAPLLRRPHQDTGPRRSSRHRRPRRRPTARHPPAAAAGSPHVDGGRLCPVTSCRAHPSSGRLPRPRHPRKDALHPKGPGERRGVRCGERGPGLLPAPRRPPHDRPRHPGHQSRAATARACRPARVHQERKMRARGNTDRPASRRRDAGLAAGPFRPGPPPG